MGLEFSTYLGFAGGIFYLAAVPGGLIAVLALPGQPRLAAFQVAMGAVLGQIGAIGLTAGFSSGATYWPKIAILGVAPLVLGALVAVLLRPSVLFSFSRVLTKLK